MAEYTNYGITQYKPQELQDDGNFGSASPRSESTSSPLGSRTVTASKVVGAYIGIKTFNTVTSNIKSLTGSTRQQEKVNMAKTIGTAVILGFATNGTSVVLQSVDFGIEYALRAKNNQIENAVRQDERRFLGKHITNSLGVAYYD